MDAQRTAAADIFQLTCRAIRSACHSPSCLILPPSKTTVRVPAHSSCGHSACRPSVVTGEQLYTALGPPPCPFSPGVVDKASQWDIASYASNLPSPLHMCVGLQLPAPSEQSCYSRRLTEHSFIASRPGSPTQKHTHISAWASRQITPWLNS